MIMQCNATSIEMEEESGFRLQLNSLLSGLGSSRNAMHSVAAAKQREIWPKHLLIQLVFNRGLTDCFQDCGPRQRQMMFEEVLMEIYSGLSRDKCYQMWRLPDSLKTQDGTRKGHS